MEVSIINAICEVFKGIGADIHKDEFIEFIEQEETLREIKENDNN